MRKPVVVVLVVASVAAGAAWAAESVADRRVVVVPALTIPLVAEDAANFRKPILKAAGSEPVAPDQERITIPVDGAVYEVVVTKPHPLGLLIPVDRPPSPRP